MTTAIRNRSGAAQSRLDGLVQSLDSLIARAERLSTEGIGGRVSPRIRLFAYGFGFGNFLSDLLGDRGDDVRDLLYLNDGNSKAVGIDRLAANWRVYKKNIESLVPSMFGDTPMAEAFATAQQRIRTELATGTYSDSPTLFVVSDGEPTDDVDEVGRIAAELRDSGVTIVSCLLTDRDITRPRQLYSTAQPEWPESARLMFECASVRPMKSPIDRYLAEFRWSAEPSARLFAQINQSEVLSEFTKMVLSPLDENSAPSATRVFVTYAHEDSAYLGPASLLDFLSGLGREGFTFFTDKQIATGELWRARIQEEITRTDVVLALVSQSFLNSPFCQDVEIAAFLQARKERGLVILPIILSPCDWKSHRWMSETQVRPRDGRTIETAYTEDGLRKQVFLEIFHDLRGVRQPNTAPSQI